MNTLGKNWFIDHQPDFEYKQYVLLAYLQYVQKNFNAQRLYPDLADLVMHYRNLLTFEENRQHMYNSFAERATIDLANFHIAYDKVVSDDALMQEIERIIQFALPKLKVSLEEGKALYEFVEEHMSITPVGIVPMYKQEGYVLIKEGVKETRVYEYQVTLFEHEHEPYRGIHTRYLTSYRHSISNTFENIKRDLLRQYPKMPNPATYAIELKMSLPLAETVEPVAKRMLIKHISMEQ